MERGGCVYILTNQRGSVLYIGVTSDLATRLKEHHSKKYVNSFSAQYNTTKLVYYECFFTMQEAIAREKAMKKWNRSWKENLINNFNSDWKDLSEEVFSW